MKTIAHYENGSGTATLTLHETNEAWHVSDSLHGWEKELIGTKDNVDIYDAGNYLVEIIRNYMRFDNCRLVAKTVEVNVIERLPVSQLNDARLDEAVQLECDLWGFTYHSEETYSANADRAEAGKFQHLSERLRKAHALFHEL